MYFFGAADHYFYLGVESGVNTSKMKAMTPPILKFWANNKTTRECQDAFEWGFCLGLALTTKEYKQLTSWPESDIVCPVVEIAKEMIKTEPLKINESNFTIIGNC